MLQTPAPGTNEGLRQPTEQQARDLQKLMFREYGKRIYRTKNLTVVRRRFHLTRVKLIDLSNRFGMEPTADELDPEIQDGSGAPLSALSNKNLRRFEALTRIARYQLAKRNYDPCCFVPMHCYLLALHLRYHIAPDSKLIL